jgi:hypothetical protein
LDLVAYYVSRDYVYRLDGYSSPSPYIYDTGALIRYGPGHCTASSPNDSRNQLRDATAGLWWSFVVTFILMTLVEAPILIYGIVAKKRSFIEAIGETLKERTPGIALLSLQRHPSLYSL